MSKALTLSMAVASILVAGPVFGAGGFFDSPVEQANRQASEWRWVTLREHQREVIKKFNVEMTAARERFWATYPDKPGAEEARKNFTGLLRDKDEYYLSVVLSNGIADMGGVGVLLDGGIRRTAGPEFQDLAEKARMGVNGFDMIQVFNASTSAAARYPDEYHKYALERDWWEFDHVHRAPAGFEKPETYGVYLYHRFSHMSREAAAANYDKMADVLGKSVVYAAAKRVMDTPKNERGALDVTVARPVKIGPGGSEVEDYSVPMPDGVIGVFADPLTAMEHLATRDDDRRYALYLLSTRNYPNGRDWDRTTKWAFADATYKQLVMAFGEKPLLEAAHAVRTAPKRQIDGTVMDQKALGATRAEPFSVFTDILTRRNPRGYVRAALLFKERLASEAAVDAAYKTFVSSGNEAEVLAAAGRLAAGKPNLLYHDELRSLVDVLTSPPEPEKPPEVMVDYPEYFAWKGFSAGAKVTYTSRFWQLGRNSDQLVTGRPEGTVSYLLKSIDAEKASLWFTQTAYDQYTGRPRPSRDDEIAYPAKIMQKVVAANAARAVAAGPVAPGDAMAPAAASLGLEEARVWSKVATISPVESGEETIEIDGKKIATKWQSVTYTFDPASSDNETTVTVKVWTSKAVPRWLVRKTEDKLMVADVYHPGGIRVVAENSLVSFAGFTPPAPDPSVPVVGAYQPPPRALNPGAAVKARTAATATKPVEGPPAPTSAAPARAAANPVVQPAAVPSIQPAAIPARAATIQPAAIPARAATSQPVAVPVRSATNQPAAATPTPFFPSASTPASSASSGLRRQPEALNLPPEQAAQLEFIKRYSAVMVRISQAKSGLLQWQRKQGGSGAPAELPANIRDARDYLDSEMQAILRAMSSRDNAQAEQHMRFAEESAAVIEQFVKG